MSQRSVVTIKFKGESVTLVHNARDLAVSQNVPLHGTVAMINGTALKGLRSFVNFFSDWRNAMIQEVISKCDEHYRMMPSIVSFSELHDEEEDDLEIFLEVSVSRESTVSMDEVYETAQPV